jgi:hypothetical protein
MEIKLGIAVVVIITIVVFIKGHIDERKGKNSAEKSEIRELINSLIPNGKEYTAAYGIWEDLDLSVAGVSTVKTTTTYNYYAVAFKPGVLYYIPLSYLGGEMSFDETYCLTKENLGMINAKKGQDWSSYYDKEQKPIVHITVQSSNTKDDKYHPVNIQQKEEAQAYADFVQQFMNDVNLANGVEVTGKYMQPLKK